MRTIETMICAISEWAIVTHPRSRTLVPHGSPSGLGSVPMKSLVMLRRKMSIPSVTMATANSSSPSIGLMKIRSTAMPSTPAAISATTTESDHCSHSGAPSINRPGKLMVVANAATR